MLNTIDMTPKNQMLLTEIIQRSLFHSRSYWAKPTKVLLGKTLELVKLHHTEHRMQMTNTPTAVTIIGVVPITAGSLARGLRLVRPAVAAGYAAASSSL